MTTFTFKRWGLGAGLAGVLGASFAAGCSLIAAGELDGKPGEGGGGGATASGSSSRSASHGSGEASGSTASGSGGGGGDVASATSGPAGSSSGAGAADAGCDAKVESDPKNCGQCGHECVVGSNVSSTSCEDGECAVVCSSGYGHCVGAADGCETQLGTKTRCGACDDSCPTGSLCVGGSCTATSAWQAISTASAPAARQMAASAWISSGSVLGAFLWGGAGASGDLADGAIYDNADDAWVDVVATGGPGARNQASAVWSGAAVIVWGGGTGTSGNAVLATGGRYDPVARTWKTTATSGAPAARRGHFAAWTGARMLVWGGTSASGALLGDGGLYDPKTNTWSPMAAPPAAVAARTGVAVTWTGAELVLFGGRGTGAPMMVSNEGYAYDPSTNQWSTYPPAGATGAPPSPRANAFLGFGGGRLLIWGGRDQMGNPLGDGAVWTASTNAWAATPGSMGGGGPARAAPFGEIGWGAYNPWKSTAVLVGGVGAMPPKDYKVDTTILTLLGWQQGKNPSAEHGFGVSVWTGEEMILFSGLDKNGKLITGGERYVP